MNGTEKQNETSMEIPAEDSRVTMGNQTEKKHRFHLKMPQKGRKHSVKKRIAYTFIATMAATLLIIGLINYFFLGSFYIRDKEHILAESFQKLNATGGDRKAGHGLHRQGRLLHHRTARSRSGGCGSRF